VHPALFLPNTPPLFELTMDMTAEAVIAIVGIVVAVPSAALAVRKWKRYRRAKSHQRVYDRGMTTCCTYLLTYPLGICPKIWEHIHFSFFFLSSFLSGRIPDIERYTRPSTTYVNKPEPSPQVSGHQMESWPCMLSTSTAHIQLTGYLAFNELCPPSDTLTRVALGNALRGGLCAWLHFTGLKSMGIPWPGGLGFRVRVRPLQEKKGIDLGLGLGFKCQSLI